MYMNGEQRPWRYFAHTQDSPILRPKAVFRLTRPILQLLSSEVQLY